MKALSIPKLYITHPRCVGHWPQLRLLPPTSEETLPCVLMDGRMVLVTSMLTCLPFKFWALFISSICLHISAQLSQAPATPLHFPCYGKLYLSAHLPCPFLRSVFQDVDTRYQDIDHFATSQFSSKQVKCKICPECLFFTSTHSHSQQRGRAVTLRIRPHATVSYALWYILCLFSLYS